MLKGHSTLFQRLPHLIEVTGDAGLRWTYTSTCLSNSWRLMENTEALIEEGVQYYTTGARTPAQAVRFYRTVALYYIQSRFPRKATEFTKLALLLARQADDIELQLMCMDIEAEIAQKSQDPYWMIEVVHKAREIARFTSDYWEYHCIQWEAWATCQMGNLPRAIDLCTQGEELLISNGMESSDKYLELLDIRAEVYFIQSDYIEARHFYKQILDRTSPTCSPWYHAWSLSMIAQIDIFTEREVTGILKNLNGAEAVYAALGSNGKTCSWVAAELELYRGNTENARSSFIACLSGARTSDLRSRGCLAALGNPKHKMHGTMDTFRWAMIYLAFERKMKKLAGMSDALRCLAAIYTTLWDEETALNLFHAALEGGTKMNIHRLRAECMVGIGDIMFQRGEAMQAEEMWTGAHLLFIRSSRRRDADSIRKQLEQLSQTQENNSHPFLEIQDGIPGQSTDSVSIVSARLGRDTDTGESSLKRLATLSAPSLSPDNEPTSSQT
ncbi:hypothetical protein C8R44DRAFT_929185 [Mycena epipterygia]|nr:hypothetical protein C8R44DRAFT_929185 [Mycena epipterygia]